MKLIWKHWGVAIKQFGWMDGSKLFFHLKNGNDKPIYLEKWNQTFHIRPNSSDVEAFVNIYFAQEYKIAYPITPNYIIDAGANVGYFTKYIKHYYPKSTIVSIEPDDANFHQLELNSKGLSSLHLKHAGVWSSSTKLKVVDHINSGSWGLSVIEDPNGNIDSVGINELLQEYQWPYIDLLKIDIEGSEHNLFSKDLSWLEKTRIIIIETHERFYPGSSDNFEAALKLYMPNHTRYELGENIIIENRALL